MRRVGWLGAWVVLLGLSVPALADQAADIKQAIEQGFRKQFGEGENSLVTLGAVEVAPDGSGYAVVLSGIRTADGGEGSLELGSITAHVIPRDADLYEVKDIRLPETITVTKPDGASDGSISFPSQQASGTWSASMKSWLDFQMAYQGIKVADGAGTEIATVAEVAGTLASTAKSPGRWDQRGDYHMTDMRIATPEGGITIGGVTVQGDFRDLDFVKYNALAEAFATLNPDTQALTPEMTQALADITGIMSASMITYKARDIQASDSAGAPLFTLPAATIDLRAEGLDQPLARLAFAFTHTGLSLAADDPLTRDFVPGDAAVAVAFEKVPVRDLWMKGMETFAMMESMPPDQQEMAGMMFIGVLQQALTEAGTQLKLDKWRLVAAAAGLDLDGVIETSPQSMMGAVGRVQLDITGLDRIIETARTMAPPEEQEMLATLEIFRGFSNRETAADGKVVDRYDVNLTPEGQLLINGKEFNFMSPGGTAN